MTQTADLGHDISKQLYFLIHCVKMSLWRFKQIENNAVFTRQRGWRLVNLRDWVFKLPWTDITDRVAAICQGNGNRSQLTFGDRIHWQWKIISIYTSMPMDRRYENHKSENCIIYYNCFWTCILFSFQLRALPQHTWPRCYAKNIPLLVLLGSVVTTVSRIYHLPIQFLLNVRE